MENHRLSAINDKIYSTMREVDDLLQMRQHKKRVLLWIELLKQVWPELSDSFSVQALEHKRVILAALLIKVAFIREVEFQELGLTSVCSNRLQLHQRLLNAYSYKSHLLITWLLVMFWNGVINGYPEKELTKILDKVRSEIRSTSVVMWNCTFSLFFLSGNQKLKKNFSTSMLELSLRKLYQLKYSSTLSENKKPLVNDAAAGYKTCMIFDVEGKDDFLFHWEEDKNADKILNILDTMKEKVGKKIGYNTNVWLSAVELLNNLNSTQMNESRILMKRLCRSNVKEQIRLWWLDISCDTSVNEDQSNSEDNRNSSSEPSSKSPQENLSVQLRIDDSKETIIYHSKLDLNFDVIHNDELSDYFKMKKIKLVPQIALVDGTNMIKDKWYHARLYEYLPRDNTWRYSPVVIKMICKVNLGTNPKGSFRDMYEVLVANNLKITYAAKRYRRVKNHRMWKYTADVRCQTLSQYYGNLFTEKYGPKYKVQLLGTFFCQIFEDATCKKVVDFFNAETLAPSEYEFEKFISNSSFVTEKKNSELALAFGHFTSVESEHKLVVVDLQGWSVPKPDGTEYLRLTDPAIHAPMWEWNNFVGGNTNGGDEGIRLFWTKQHAECNKICKELGLKRPANY